MHKKFSTIVIGAGPGGYTTAIRLAHGGQKVALIEKEEVGGVCLNKGCIPTKILTHTSSLMEKFRKASKFGIKSSFQLDFSQLVEYKKNRILLLRKGVKSLLKNIEYFHGEAKFKENFVIQVGEEILEAENIVIATGSTPCKIFENIKTSEEILEISKLPSSIIIVGGGYIGCELASFFSQCGTKVYLLETQKQIMCNLHKSIVFHLESALKKRGVEIIYSSVKELTKTEKGYVAKTENREIEAEEAFQAVGRSCEREVEVNEFMETKTKGIWAVGDVTKKSMLAHVAIHQGLTAAENILGNRVTMKYDLIPAVIFSSPEIACIGSYKGKETSIPFSVLGKAVSEDENGLALLFTGNEGQIEGAQIVGENSSSLIMEIAIAIEKKMKVEDLEKVIHPHPTFSEIWEEAALLFLKKPLHIPL